MWKDAVAASFQVKLQHLPSENLAEPRKNPSHDRWSMGPNLKPNPTKQTLKYWHCTAMSILMEKKYS